MHLKETHMLLDFARDALNVKLFIAFHSEYASLLTAPRFSPSQRSLADGRCALAAAITHQSGSGRKFLRLRHHHVRHGHYIAPKTPPDSPIQ